MVRVFVRDPVTRTICDRVAVDIAARLPSLQETNWQINDSDNRYISLRRAHRHNLAQAITEGLPQASSLKSLSIKADFDVWHSHFSVGTLHPGSSTDPLSNAIHTVTRAMRRLKTLRITGEIDSSLFWPGPTRAISQPYWQCLERLTVRFSTRRPSGGCYFWNPRQKIVAPLETEVPPGYGHADDNKIVRFFDSALHCSGGAPSELSVTPDDDSLVPLIEAFGQACLQIPKLKSAELSTLIPAPPFKPPKNHDPPEYRWIRPVWGVWYFSPHTVIESHETDWYPIQYFPIFYKHTPQRRVMRKITDWGPKDSLRNLICKIGCEEYGMDLVERFIEDKWNIKNSTSHLVG